MTIINEIPQCAEYDERDGSQERAGQHVVVDNACKPLESHRSQAVRLRHLWQPGYYSRERGAAS